jgi:hypothetical protein
VTISGLSRDPASPGTLEPKVSKPQRALGEPSPVSSRSAGHLLLDPLARVRTEQGDDQAAARLVDLTDRDRIERDRPVTDQAASPISRSGPAAGK